MPSAQDDFAITIDRAAGLTLDATCAGRSAARASLPLVQSRLVKEAIVALERAQLKLFEARQVPWEQPQPHPAAQLEMA